MVDAIKTTVNRLELTKGRASEGRWQTPAPAFAASSVDDVRVSDAASAKRRCSLHRRRLSTTKPLAGSRKPSSAVNTRLMLILSLKLSWMPTEI